MSDYNDPGGQAMLDWILNQSRTQKGEQQYGGTQLTNLSKFKNLLNDPIMGILSGGYDPMQYVPQTGGGQQAAPPYGATDAGVQQYRSRFGSDPRLNDIFDQVDQGADQLTLNRVIDGSADYWAQQGLTPDDVKNAVSGYYNVKSDQQQALGKYQYGVDNGTGTGGSSGTGGGGGSPYGADGLPSKSNYFGIDPTLGNQLEEYVPPEVQAVQQKAAADYLARGKALADQQAQSAGVYDNQTNGLVQAAQGRGDAALGKFLMDLNQPHVAGTPDPYSTPNGIGLSLPDRTYTDNYGISAHDPTEAASEMVNPDSFAKALGSVNARNDGSFNGYDTAGAQQYATSHHGQKASLRDLFDQFTPTGRQANQVRSQRQGVRDKRYSRSREQVMQDYAQRASKQDAWSTQQAQKRTGYQPDTTLQHNLNQRLAYLLQFGR